MIACFCEHIHTNVYIVYGVFPKKTKIRRQLRPGNSSNCSVGFRRQNKCFLLWLLVYVCMTEFRSINRPKQCCLCKSQGTVMPARAQFRRVVFIHEDCVGFLGECVVANE